MGERPSVIAWALKLGGCAQDAFYCQCAIARFIWDKPDWYRHKKAYKAFMVWAFRLAEFEFCPQLNVFK